MPAWQLLVGAIRHALTGGDGSGEHGPATIIKEFANEVMQLREAALATGGATVDRDEIRAGLSRLETAALKTKDAEARHARHGEDLRRGGAAVSSRGSKIASLHNDEEPKNRPLLYLILISTTKPSSFWAVFG